MDILTYLRKIIQWPRTHSRQTGAGRSQADQVQTVLHGSRDLRKDRHEQEADRNARHLTDRSAQHAVPPRFNHSPSTDGGDKRLPQPLRQHYESRLGLDLEQVRVHTGSHAGRAARSIRAKAFTIGNDIIFGDRRYAPETAAGQRLLAHELTHVAQQASSGNHPVGHGGGPSVSSAPRGIQRDDDGSGPQLRLGGLGGSLRPWWMEPQEPRFQLRLDPEIEAELALMRMRYIQRILNPANVANSLRSIDTTVYGPVPPTNLLNVPTPSPSGPLVPAGAGPATPRAASTGDIMRAVMAVPAVDTALTNLRTQAMQRVRSDWRRLSTGERVLLVSQGVLIGGAAIAGAMSNEESRNFLLNQVQGRNLPIPGVPGLSFQFNLTGPEQRIFFNLDLARLISR